MSTTLLSPDTELIAEEGGSPISINPFSGHRHIGIFAQQGSGKTVLALDILTHALAADIPVFALDHPRIDGSSTLRDYTHTLEGDYTNLLSEDGNLFELADLGCRDILSDLLQVTLQGMVVGNSDDPYLITHCREVLSLALRQFFDDPSIQERYTVAIDGGVGSDAWAHIPTLNDFLPFCKPEKINIEDKIGTVSQAFQMIDLRLRFWVNSRVGRAIASPSTFRTDSQLLVFALRNIDNSEDAAILALSGLASILRCALQYPASIFFIDEAPILFEFPEISEMVGRLTANGAKSGIRVIIAAQDPDTVANSKAGSKIMQNLTTRLIGRIVPEAIASFERVFDLPHAIIARNASKAFFPEKSGMYSKWLLLNAGDYTYCRYYPGEVQLGIVANNPDEQNLRNEVFAENPNRLVAMATFAHKLSRKLRAG